MSLYNMVHGRNPLALPLLAMLDIHPDRFGRFRDVYLHKEESGEIQIVVHTRCGGGNREDYQSVFVDMQEHPLFIKDRDDSFDCTYCDFYFRVPDEFKELVLECYEKTDNAPPSERWQKLFDRMRKSSYE